VDVKLEPKIKAVVTKNPLFEGITDIENLLKCVNAEISSKQKGEILLYEQESTTKLGVLLEGEVRATRLDPTGRQLVLAHHTSGSIYGDVLSLSPSQKSPVTVTAFTDVKVLLLPFSGIIKRCEKDCERHNRLLQNLLGVVAGKYFTLFGRLECIMRPTLREKIMCYLEECVRIHNAKTFNIPFDRSALAEYLGCDRSALSRELSAMKKEGIIGFYKNTFSVTEDSAGF
jgi:CRP-like cAMP-binding protein